MSLPGVALGGPWSELQDAVETLETRPDDPRALGVVRRAEESLEAEMATGRMEVGNELLEVYEELVLALPAGGVRVDALRGRLARTLVASGDAISDRDLDAAARRWALASRLDGASGALARLRPLVLPPSDASPGDRWVAAADGAELVWLPSRQSRVGCSVGDRLCRGDEVFFRYVSVPGVWIESTEVTNRRYDRCVAQGWCRPPDDAESMTDTSRADEPVVGVDWDRAVAFAVWVGRRLPSEAEWERAARDADDRRRYPWGTSRVRAQANVWFDGQYADPFASLAPVASFEPSPTGLYDLAGNAWEWCADRYADRLRDLPDDGSPYRAGDLGRVLRGGSWRRTVELARVSSRTWQDEGYAADDVGFRCVMDAVTAVDPMEVGTIAQRIWPVPAGSVRPLVDADLDAEDRAYLERRALTWLLFEERYDQALPRAVGLLEDGRAADVAEDLLVRVEQLILELLDEGRIEDLERPLLAYRDATEGRAVVADRSRRLLQRATRALRADGQRLLDEGTPDRAEGRFRLALELSPADPLLARSLARTRPGAGQVIRWPGDGREMVWIPGGDVRIGASVGDTDAEADEHPARVVSIDGFWIDRTEVTNREYRRCVDAGACTPPADRTAFDDPNQVDHPVLFVTWFQARSYSRWAGKRLPSETEWECAARAGTATPYPWGLMWEAGKCNGYGAAGADRWGGSSPVASFPPNQWNVVDLLGNAAEWVADLYHRDYRWAPRDGRPWNQLTGGPTQRERAVRGGGWDDLPQRLRVSYRADRRPDDVDRAVGFRCAADGSSETGGE